MGGSSFTPLTRNWKFACNDAASPTTCFANENTQPTTCVCPNETIFRIRQNIAETGGKIGRNISLSIQYSLNQTDWVSMGAGNHFNYANGAATDGATLSALLLSDTAVCNIYDESGGNTITIDASTENEFDFTVQPTSNAAVDVYYFRPVVNGTGVEAAGGETQPSFCIDCIVTPPTPITGNATLSIATSGQMIGDGAMAGTTATIFAVSGNITSAASTEYIDGNIALTFSTNADAIATGNFIGNSSIAFTTSADAIASGTIAGTTAIAFTTSADAVATGLIAGSTSITFGVTGNITEAGSTANISGNAVLTIATSADAIGTGTFIGDSLLSFTTNSEMIASGSIEGNTGMAFAVSGDITEASSTGYISGNAAITIATSASEAIGTGDVDGNTAIDFAVTGNITVQGSTSYISGNAAIAITDSADAIATGNIVASSNIVFTNSSDMIGIALLGGVTTMAIGVSDASIYGTGNIVGYDGITFNLSGQTDFWKTPMSGSSILSIYAEGQNAIGTGNMSGDSHPEYTKYTNVYVQQEIIGVITPSEVTGIIKR